MSSDHHICKYSTIVYLRSELGGIHRWKEMRIRAYLSLSLYRSRSLDRSSYPHLPQISSLHIFSVRECAIFSFERTCPKSRLLSKVLTSIPDSSSKNQNLAMVESKNTI